MIPAPLIDGFLLSIGLIIAIGSQNLFVLKQGLTKNHVFAAVFTCTVCDFILICLGAMGLGSFFVHHEWLSEFAVWGGAIFLSYYGLKCWINIIKGNLTIQNVSENSSTSSLKAVILAALGFSFLNPHAFLDTIVLIGGISSQFELLSDRLLFSLGAGIASALWFFSLGFASRLLRPLFQKRGAAATFEFTSGSIMFWIAWGLVA